MCGFLGVQKKSHFMLCVFIMGSFLVRRNGRPDGTVFWLQYQFRITHGWRRHGAEVLHFT